MPKSLNSVGLEETFKDLTVYAQIFWHEYATVFFFTWVCGINKHRSYDYGACWKDSVVVSVISRQQ